MTTYIRAESVALLAEALHASCEAEWDIKAARGVTEMTLHFPDAHRDRAADILAASPTLARRLAFATAWEMAEAALPEGWAINVVWGTVTSERWGVNAGPFPAKPGYIGVTAGGPTPTAALLALTAKLREAIR